MMQCVDGAENLAECLLLGKYTVTVAITVVLMIVLLLLLLQSQGLLYFPNKKKYFAIQSHRIKEDHDVFVEENWHG